MTELASPAPVHRAAVAALARDERPGVPRQRRSAGARGAALRHQRETSAPQPLDVERYISREFHDREVEKVWRKVWQFVCREDHIPNPGDHITYDIADDKLDHHAPARRQHQGALQRLPAPRPRAASGGRPGERAALPVPRLLLEHRRHARRTLPCAWDFPRDRPARSSRSPRPRSPPGTDSSSSTRIPTRSRSRTSSARCSTTGSAGTTTTGSCTRTSAASSTATGRSPARRSSRASTRWRPTRR